MAAPKTSKVKPQGSKQVTPKEAGETGRRHTEAEQRAPAKPTTWPPK